MAEEATSGPAARPPFGSHTGMDPLSPFQGRALARTSGAAGTKASLRSSATLARAALARSSAPGIASTTGKEVLIDARSQQEAAAAPFFPSPPFFPPPPPANSLYAVKKVRLRRREAYQKVLREVTTLARLDHPFIVRYHAAWLEEHTAAKALHTGGDSDEETSEGDDSRFDSEDITGPTIGRSDSSAPATPATPSLVLYIQMQLCEHSLHDWLRHRWGMDGYGGGASDGASSFEASAAPQPMIGQGPAALHGIVEALSIFQQMAEGVAYIHAQNLIHRDLKPRNVFLRRKTGGQPGWYVAIGDFGLARQLPSGDVMPMPAAACGDAAEAALHHVALLPGAAHSMSSGVGTETYAPPEQLHSNNYSHKVG